MSALPLSRLRAAVRQVSVALNPSIPVSSLRGIRIHGGALSATNLEMAARVDVPEADVDCLVHGATLRAALDSLPDGDVTLELADEGLVIQGSKARAALRLMQADDWPALPTIDEASVVGRLILPAEAIPDFIAASGAALNDETQPVLSALTVTWSPTAVRAFAVDRIRLYRTGSWPVVDDQGGGHVMFMPNALRALPSGESVAVTIDETRVLLEAGPLHLYARTVMANTIDPDAVTPQDFAGVVRLTEDAAAGIASIAAPFRVTGDKEQVRPIVLSLAPGASEVQVDLLNDHLASSFAAELEEPYEGPAMEIKANPLQFAGALAFGGRVVQVVGAIRPVRFTGNGDHEALVMPINPATAAAAAA